MVAIKVGDIRYYYDSGDKFKVEVLDISLQNYGKSVGEEYKLQLLEVVYTTAQNPPLPGLEFVVWRAIDAGGYAGWSLRER